MNAADTVRACFAALDAHDLERAASYLTDDFAFHFIDTSDKDGVMVFIGLLNMAFPDLRWNPSDPQVGEHAITTASRLSGTFTGPLALPGRPPISPTGRRFILPPEPITLTMRGDLIADWFVEEVSGGGMRGILEQVAP